MSLVEVAVATSVLLLVLGSVLMMLETGTRTQARQQARSEKMDEVRGAVGRMTKEIRQALAVRGGSDASRLEVRTLIVGREVEIIYQVEGDGLTRSVDGGTPITLVSGVASNPEGAPAFAYDPSVNAPTSVRLTLSAQPKPGGAPVTIATNVSLRNLA